MLLLLLLLLLLFLLLNNSVCSYAVMVQAKPGHVSADPWVRAGVWAVIRGFGCGQRVSWVILSPRRPARHTLLVMKIDVDLLFWREKNMVLRRV